MFDYARRKWYTIARKPTPKSIADFARFRQLHLTITEQSDNRWTASFDGIEVKEGPILRGVYGDGTTPLGAVSDYIRQIRGQPLVHNAYSKKRREFTAWQEMALPEELIPTR